MKRRPIIPILSLLLLPVLALLAAETIDNAVAPGTIMRVSTGWGTPGFNQGNLQCAAGASSLTIAGPGGTWTRSWDPTYPGSSFGSGDPWIVFTPMVPGIYVAEASFGPQYTALLQPGANGVAGIVWDAPSFGLSVVGSHRGSGLCRWVFQVSGGPESDPVACSPGEEGPAGEPPCPPPKDSREAAPSGEGQEPVIKDASSDDTPGGSLIDNLRLAHIHLAMDYDVPVGGQSACGSCATAPTDASLPRFRVIRVHRYRDLGWHGSFGPGVYSQFDVQMAIDTVTGTIEYFDPLRKASHVFARTGTGTWTATGSAFDSRDITLRTGAGVLTDDPASARSATLRLRDGSSRTFDVFAAGGGTTTDFLARQTQVSDRHGNSLTISYVHPDAQQVAAGVDPGAAWRIAGVTDAYGHAATFSSGRSDGQWVVTAIACPNGSTLSYGHGGSLVGLGKVTFPDGAITVVSTTYDATRDQQRIDFRDAGAAGQHRNKSIWLTNGTWNGAPGLGGLIQPWNCVRRVTDGVGVETYRNWVTTQPTPLADGRMSNAQVFIQEGAASGGGVHFRRLLAASGSALSVARAAVVPAAGDLPHSFMTQRTYTNDAAARRLVQRTASGTGTRYERDPTLGVPRATYWLGAGQTIGTLLSSRTITGFGEDIDVTDALGRQTTHTYNGTATQLLSTTEGVGTALQATTTFAYNGRGQVTTVTDPRNKASDRTYDARGYLTSEQQPSDTTGGPRATVTWERDAAGRLSASSDPLSNRTVYTYDSRNRIVRIEYADASYETFAYGTGGITANLRIEHRQRNGAIERYAYDAHGRCIRVAVADPTTGGLISLRTRTYAAGSDLLTSETVDGEMTSFAYDARRRLISIVRTPRSGRSLSETRSYDDEDRLVVVTDGYGRRTFSIYDERGREVRTLRELVVGGLAIGHAAATAPRILTANPPYVIDEQEYDVGNQLVARIDGRGIRTSYAYDAVGRLSSETRAVGTAAAATTSYVYDVAGNRTQITSPRGVVTSMSYTGRNLLAGVTEAVGTPEEQVVRTLTYSLTGKPLTDTDALGGVTIYGYGGCCDRLLSITDPGGFLTQFTYDAVGNRLTVTDANSLTTATAYDARNRVVSTTNAAGEIRRVQYDDCLLDGIGIDAVPVVAAALGDLGLAGGLVDGSAIAVRDPTGATSYELRDGLGRRVITIDALGHRSSMTYDQVVDGLVGTVQTDAVGHAERSCSDAAGHTRQQVDAEGHAITAGFDADGNQVWVRDPAAVGWDATYDALGRIVSRSNTRTPVGTTTWNYDLDGNRLSETDADNRTETSTYDLRNRRTTVVDRVNGTTRFGYDAVGNLVSISDADNEASGNPQVAKTTQYAYDARRLLVAEAFPTGQQGRTLRVYGYDAGGRLASRHVGILSGAFSATPAFSGTVTMTTYGYDAANRLTSRQYGDGLNDGFEYDDAGRLTIASSGRYATTVGRVYDAAGRLTDESLSVPDGSLVGTTLQSATWTVTNTYADDGSLATQTYPTGSVVTRSYTARHQLELVGFRGQRVSQRTYDAAGRLSTSLVGSAGLRTEERSYLTGSPLVASITSPGVTGFSYTYDVEGRKLTEADGVTPANSQTFSYDHAGRLTGWSAGSDSQTWNLTQVGDWASTTRNGATESRQHTAVHEATQVGTNILSYDVQGNLTTDEKGTALAWDPENRLMRARVTRDASPTGFGAVASYRYDALGRRIGKTVDGTTTFYLPAGAQTVVEIDRPALPSTQAAIDGADADGALANLAEAPASGGILPGAPGTVTRINFQPATTATPAGFIRDTGKMAAVRTNGLTYGWSTDVAAQAVVRGGAVPLVEYDTFIQAQTDSTSASWSIALPNGTYPVVVVAGDALSTEQTNHLLIDGIFREDLTPSVLPWYEAGNFDGYALEVTVTDGTLSIAPGSGAYHAKLCYVEIGTAGTPGTLITPEIIATLAARIAQANAQTGANPIVRSGQREYVYGSYVDEVLCYQATVGVVTERYFPHYNSLYSVAALTDATGTVVERFTYNAYGAQKITDGSGNVTRARSVVGWDRGFTGYINDQETGLYHARARPYSPSLGRFLSRDPLGYEGGGMGLYGAYFVPSLVDPLGTLPCLPNAECQNMLVEIMKNTADLLSDLRRYDPISDAQGGFPIHGDPNHLTKPGGHYQEIFQRRLGLKRKITRYIKFCISCDDPEGGPPAQRKSIPRCVDGIVNQKIEPPKVSLGPSNIVGDYFDEMLSGPGIYVIGAGVIGLTGGGLAAIIGGGGSVAATGATATVIAGPGSAAAAATTAAAASVIIAVGVHE